MSGAHVLLLTPGIVGADGIATVARHAARALVAHPGVGRLSILCKEEGNDDPLPAGLDSAAVLPCGGSRVRLVRAAVREAFSAVRPSHVLTMHVNLGPAAVPAQARGARHFVFLHGIEVWRPLQWHRRMVLEGAHRLISNSDFTRRRVLDIHPYLARREIEVCHLGAEFPQASGSTSRARAALIVGRMEQSERSKGHDRLLEIWRDVATRTGGLRLIVVGDGSDRRRLEEKAHALRLDDVVQFRGRVPDSELSRLYGEVELFVMPASAEGFGIVYAEAMGHGLPCVAGRGAPEEVVIHAETGLIVDVESATELGDSIVRLANDKKLRERLGGGALARARAHFTEVAFHGRITELLEL